MIAAVSPSFMCYEDTINTLKYADRAKSIKTVVKRNIVNVQHHISNYKNIIGSLRSEIEDLEGQLEPRFVRKPITYTKTPPPALNKKNYESEDLKRKKMALNIHFEKEAIQKKQILELDQESEMLAFKLFGSEMDLRKLEKQGTSKNMEQEALTNEIKKF